MCPGSGRAGREGATIRMAGNGQEREGKPAPGMQVSEWHNRSAKVGGIRRDCLREQGGPGARQLPRVSTSLASLSRLSSPSLPNHLFLTIYARLFFPFAVRSPLSPLFSPSRSFSTIVLSIYTSVLLPRS